MAHILVIDDDEMVCESMVRMISDLGHDVSYSTTLNEGLQRVLSHSYDVVLLDVQLPDGNGLRAIPQIREQLSAPEVIIITGFGDPDGAELAINSGAWDYVEKPATKSQISLPLLRAIDYRKNKTVVKPILLKRDKILGNSPKLQEALDMVAQVASTDSNILITGETGVGKELFARAIHENSKRSTNAFVVVDCAALPETLVESILFGHEKGAFSGADRSKIGFVKEADGGTLFLDEVGELPLSMQKSFLRVLQERRFTPIGASQEVTSNFRLVAATNRNLGEMVQDGAFRRDLLFRLRSIAIEIPSLRNRKNDILQISMNTINSYCENNSIDKKGLAPDFIEIIMTYSWPGNVRELINTMDHALAEAGSDPTLISFHLPRSIRAQVAKNSVSDKKTTASHELDFSFLEMGQFPTFKSYKDETEYEYLKKLLELTKGIKTEACKKSGISRPHLYELLKKHNL